MLTDSQTSKLRLVGLLFIVVGCLFIIRLFHLQVINSSIYRQKANEGQVKSLEIEAERGKIYAHSGDRLVPLVLNQRHWLVFSDTQFVDDPQEIIAVLGEYQIELSQNQRDALSSNSRYVVLKSDIDDKVKVEIESHDIRGIYFQERSIRAYPEGSLASHVLGFLNTDDQAQYGIEQKFNDSLTGIPGRLRAVTDVKGVPLAFEKDNIDIDPQPGSDITLTLDVPLQRGVERILASVVDETDALSGSVIVLDASDGAIKALTNYPTYNPAAFNQAGSNLELFKNQAVSATFEPGSVMKTLIMATALDKGVVNTESSFYNTTNYVIDGSLVTNATFHEAGDRPVVDILIRSLNTGAIYLLSQLGGGELNEQARQTYYNYLTGPFRLGQKTGIDLPGEEYGLVIGPEDDYGIDIRYANMTFGQGLTVTLVQLASVYGALFNGGTYYQPYIVEQIGDSTTSPTILDEQILPSSTTEQLYALMQQVGKANHRAVQYDGLDVAGKTGTAQIASEEGGYLEDAFTGTFVGYVKNKQDTLIVAVKIDRPDVLFAGFYAAVPVYEQVVNEIVKLGRITR